MKKVFTLSLASALLLAAGFLQAGNAQAETANTPAESMQAGAPPVVNYTDVIALQRSNMQLQQQTVVLYNLQLTPEESEAFWPVFRAYQNDYEPIGDRIVKLILDFSNKFESMTDEEASAMLKEAQDIQQAETTLKSSYVAKFSAALPPKKVLRFYQIDNKLRTEIRYAMSLEIPLLEAESSES